MGIAGGQPSLQGCMPAQAILDQKCGEAAAAAAFREGLLLESIHHTGWKGDIDPFRFRGFSNLPGADLLMLRLQLFLKFLEQVLQK